jgi:hypothetical protein
MANFYNGAAGISASKYGGTPPKNYFFGTAGLPVEDSIEDYVNYSFVDAGAVQSDRLGRYSIGGVNESSVSAGALAPEIGSGIINGLSEFSYGESELFLTSGNAPMVSSYFSYGESTVLHYFRTYAEGCEYDTELTEIVFAYNPHRVGIGAAYFPPANSILFNENTHSIYTGASYSNILSLYQYVQNEHLIGGGASYTSSEEFYQYVTNPQSVNIGAAYYPTVSTLKYGSSSHNVYTGASYFNIPGTIFFEANGQLVSAGASYNTITSEFIFDNYVQEIIVSDEFRQKCPGRILFVPFDHALWACRHPDFYTAPIRPVGTYTAPDRVTGEGYTAPTRPSSSYSAPRRHGSRFCYPI